MNHRRKFLHTPSNDIIITDNRGNESIFDLEIFQKVEPEYKLPKGCIGQEYVSSEKHILYTGSSQIEGEFPWKEGERYVKRGNDMRLLEKTEEEDEKYVDEVASLMENKNDLDYNEEDDNFYRISSMIHLMWEHLFEDIDNKKEVIEMKKLIKKREKFRGNWRKNK